MAYTNKEHHACGFTEFFKALINCTVMHLYLKHWRIS